MRAALSCSDVGIAEVTSSEMSVEHAMRVAAALDTDADLTEGSALPWLWHWAFFTSTVPTAGLGGDGHPRVTPGGATADLPRRMWAGGRLHAHTPLILGAPATRRSRVARAERKSGSSGNLLVLTVVHDIDQNGRLALTEEQDLIYRAGSSVPTEAPIGDHRSEAPSGGWSDSVTIDSVTLFRFSAVTFNSHRIHYDQSYAKLEEGYPSLVVHGPLTANLLAASARRRDRERASFEFRASAPLYAGVPFSLVGEPSGSAVELRAVRNDGAVAMTARFA